MVLLFLVKETVIVMVEEPTKGMRTEALKYEACRCKGNMETVMIQRFLLLARSRSRYA